MHIFRLAHLSDPHLGPLPDVRIAELLSKRALGYINWHRNRAVATQPAELSAIVSDVAAQDPDHIAVTGDLVNIGLDAEILAAQAWLESLGAPTEVSVVPGNHDAYVPGALRRACLAWGPFMVGDGASGIFGGGAFGGGVASRVPSALQPRTMFPYLRVRDGVALIGVSSALATAPFSARGAFREPQASRLEALLEESAGKDLFRVVMIHHPPIDALTAPHKRLIGSRRFLRVLARAGAEMVLHGHTHQPTVAWAAGPRGAIPVVCVPSASATGAHSPRARYNLFEIAGAPGRWQCTMIERGAADGEGVVDEFGRRDLAPEGAKAGLGEVVPLDDARSEQEETP